MSLFFRRQYNASTRHAKVDSTMYTTTSMLRTMEQILGLPPMTQYDAGATVMYRCFGPAGDKALAAYENQPALIDLAARNTAPGADAEASAKLDWSDVDKTDPATLNGILWRAWKPGVPCLDLRHG